MCSCKAHSFAQSMARSRFRPVYCSGHNLPPTREEYNGQRQPMPTPIVEFAPDPMAKTMPKEKGDLIKGRNRMSIEEGEVFPHGDPCSHTPYWPLDLD